jgi:flagellar basal-body rod protein FlgG
MIRAMYSAASGMSAQEKCVSVIANNISNVNTTGFKSQRAYFEDLFYETYLSSAASVAEKDDPLIQIGHGTKLSSTPRDFSQGEVQETKSPLDLMIRGDGFFRVLMPDGTFAYTRDGSLKLTSDGYLVDSNGFPLDPEIVVPEETTQLTVSTDGKVYALYTGETEPSEEGELTLTKFINPQGLEAIGNNLYKPTLNSGDPIEGIPGTDGLGLIDQGYLEISNVKVVEEMVMMILAQRAYELNSKVITTADTMLSIANRIR